MTESEVEEAVLASAVPIFPPRPDAIATLVTTDDFLPGAQTLLYSVKKSLSTKTKYPPELVVLVTHSVSKKVREALHPAFCTRIIEVEPIAFPPDSINKKISSNISWDRNCGLTKLHIFRLEVYETLLYLDADCLVVQDVTPLLELGKVYVESEPLVAAAPDIFPPDKFNAGVMVVRPKQSVFDNMMAQRSLLRTYDGGDTGFLNAYFSDWYRDMPPMSRLPFGYNAQRFLYHCTYAKQPNYWDVAVAPDLTVIHYSSTPKPWGQSAATGIAKVAQDHLDEESAQNVQNSVKTGALEKLWSKWYQRSRNYATKFHRDQKKEQKQKAAAVAAAEKAKVAAKRKKHSTPMDPKKVHKLVTKRYKELRREGMSLKDAMQQAREECGATKDDDLDAGQRVAAMFGVPLL